MDRHDQNLPTHKQFLTGTELPQGRKLRKTQFQRNNLFYQPPLPSQHEEPVSHFPLAKKKPPIYCREDRINTLKIKEWILKRKIFSQRPENNFFRKKVSVEEVIPSTDNLSLGLNNKPGKIYPSPSKIHLVRGFTLIELLIVVAIAGILSAIALPMYQDYVARSQLLEAVTIGGAYKLTIEDHIQNVGSFPGDNAMETIFGELADAAGDGTLVGFKTIQEITLTPDGAGSGGVFELTVADVDGIKAPLRGSTVTFTRADSGAWSCVSSVTEEGLVPKGCDISA
ncbi:MAG: pilin [Pseudomonadota bacterium]